jgi:hypothetical protein
MLISKQYRIGGVLTNVSSFKLTVTRVDTNVVVVNNASMDNPSTGVYQYEFTEPAPGLTYTVGFAVTNSGATMEWEETVVGVAVTSASGRYHSRSDIEFHFGIGNLKSWLDMDNDQNAVKINTRCQNVIDRTESWIDSRFRRSRYKIPFDPVPLEITEICAILSGSKAYEPRSQEDVTEGTNPQKIMVATKRKIANQMINEILAGKLFLDTTDLVDTEVPQVINDPDTHLSNIRDPGEIPLPYFDQKGWL